MISSRVKRHCSERHSVSIAMHSEGLAHSSVEVSERRHFGRSIVVAIAVELAEVE